MVLKANTYRWRRVVGLLWLFFRLFTIFVSLLLCLILLARYVNPQTTTFFALLSLSAPFVLLVNVLLLLFWTLKWQKIAFISLFPMIFAVWIIGDFVQMRVSTNNDAQGGGGRYSSLSVLTYNTHSMGSYLGARNNFSRICEDILALNPDLVCLQEFSVRDSSQLLSFSSLSSRYVFRSYSSERLRIGGNGLVVLSRYPLSNGSYHSFEGSDNGFMQCDMVVGSDTIRVLNCHLQSTELGFLNGVGIVGVLRNFGDVVSSLSRNFSVRAVQAMEVSAVCRDSPYPVLIMGDMNSPPLTYTYRVVRGDLGDAFVSAGEGVGSTYKLLGGFLRIDDIFYDRTLYRCVDYQALDWGYSDHRPVYVKLKKRK